MMGGETTTRKWRERVKREIVVNVYCKCDDVIFSAVCEVPDRNRVVNCLFPLRFESECEGNVEPKGHSNHESATRA